MDVIINNWEQLFGFVERFMHAGDISRYNVHIADSKCSVLCGRIVRISNKGQNLKLYIIFPSNFNISLICPFILDEIDDIYILGGICFFISCVIILFLQESSRVSEGFGEAWCLAQARWRDAKPLTEGRHYLSISP